MQELVYSNTPNANSAPYSWIKNGEHLNGLQDGSDDSKGTLNRVPFQLSQNIEVISNNVKQLHERLSAIQVSFQSMQSSLGFLNELDNLDSINSMIASINETRTDVDNIQDAIELQLADINELKNILQGVTSVNDELVYIKTVIGNRDDYDINGVRTPGAKSSGMFDTLGIVSKETAGAVRVVSEVSDTVNELKAFIASIDASSLRNELGVKNDSETHTIYHRIRVIENQLSSTLDTINSIISSINFPSVTNIHRLIEHNDSKISSTNNTLSKTIDKVNAINNELTSDVGIKARISAAEQAIDLYRASFSNVLVRISDAENDIRTIKDVHTASDAKLTRTIADVTSIRSEMDELENRLTNIAAKQNQNTKDISELGIIASTIKTKELIHAGNIESYMNKKLISRMNNVIIGTELNKSINSAGSIVDTNGGRVGVMMVSGGTFVSNFDGRIVHSNPAVTFMIKSGKPFTIPDGVIEAFVTLPNDVSIPVVVPGETLPTRYETSDVVSKEKVMDIIAREHGIYDKQIHYIADESQRLSLKIDNCNVITKSFTAVVDEIPDVFIVHTGFDYFLSNATVNSFVQTIETLFNNISINTTADVLVITPYKCMSPSGYNFSFPQVNENRVALKQYADALSELAKKYSFTVCDLFGQSGLNETNIRTHTKGGVVTPEYNKKLVTKVINSLKGLL